MEIEGILQQQLVNGGAGWVGQATFGDRGFAISLRVYIEVTAGQQHPLRHRQAGGLRGPGARAKER